MIIIFSIMVLIPLSIIVHGVSTKVYVRDFDSYKDGFLMIAQKMITLDEEVGLIDGQNIYIHYDDNHKIYYQLNNNNTYFTEEERKAIKNISDALYNAGGLGRIVVYNDRVTFIAEGNLYAIAYMINNKKPTFMTAPNEKWNIKVKKIEKYWYHIKNKS